MKETHDEVWVLHGHAHTDVGLLPETLRRSITDYGVRFLHSGLKCKACAWHEPGRMKMINTQWKVVPWCTRFFERKPKTRPACMSFKKKKK